MDDRKIYRLLAPTTAKSQVASALYDIYLQETVDYGTKYFGFPEKKSMGILMEIIKSIWNEVQIGRIEEQDFDLDNEVSRRRKEKFIYYAGLRMSKKKKNANNR